jgi:hypothetical protein
MSPTDLYSATLSALTDARAQMLSPAWQAELDKLTADQRLTASKALLRVEQAILVLSNAALSDIAGAMQANEQGLTSATASLEDALKDITKVQDIIQTITTALNVVGKILPLL